MTNKTLEDFGRRSLDLNTPKIVEVLPEYFRSEYPQLIKLLDTYSDYLDSDGNINDDLEQILKVRDINGVSIDFLNFLLQETGMGLTEDQFDDPRAIARFLPDFYKYKGSLFSAKSFFAALYNEEVEVIYPKDNIFIVGESFIGPESLRFIQDGALYQTLSILIKSSKPISQWREQYKRFVHPAGFYLGGEVLSEGIVNLALDCMPVVIPDSSANHLSVLSTTEIVFSAPFDPLTGFYQQPDSDTQYHIDLERDIISISADSASRFDSQYGTMFDYATPNTVGLSDSHVAPRITWSSTTENFARSYQDSSGSNLWSS